MSKLTSVAKVGAGLVALPVGIYYGTNALILRSMRKTYPDAKRDWMTRSASVFLSAVLSTGAVPISKYVGQELIDRSHTTTELSTGDTLKVRHQWKSPVLQGYLADAASFVNLPATITIKNYFTQPKEFFGEMKPVEGQNQVYCAFPGFDQEDTRIFLSRNVPGYEKESTVPLTMTSYDASCKQKARLLIKEDLERKMEGWG